MSVYFTIKFIHIIGVTMMLGATICNGVLHFSAMKSNSIQAVAVTMGHIMKINHFIMLPSFFVLIFSGLSMVYELKISFNEFWVWSSSLLTIILVSEFVGGYFIEKRMNKIIKKNHLNEQENLPEKYWKLVKIAAPIGSTATLFSLIIVYFMIAKPI